MDVWDYLVDLLWIIVDALGETHLQNMVPLKPRVSSGVGESLLYNNTAPITMCRLLAGLQDWVCRALSY